MHDGARLNIALTKKDCWATTNTEQVFVPKSSEAPEFNPIEIMLAEVKR